MIPMLYLPIETVFDSNGVGPLPDAVSCIVNEERNGAFELQMSYPSFGLHYNEIGYRSIILAKPNPTSQAQPFRVYRITKPMGGLSTVYAQHISYDLSGVVMPPFSANSLDEMIQAIQNDSIPSNSGFTYQTDKSSGAKISSSAPISVRSLLGGVRGSILDVYGGEYEFDRYSVKLWKARGADNGVTIRYGKNLTTLEQDANCASVYTAVYPYWYSEGTLVELTEKTIAVDGTFDFVRILPLDLTSAFDTQPTEEQLRTSAQYYIRDNKVGVPKVSLEVEFEKLGTDKVSLCDTVSVIFTAQGISTKAKVVSTTYDVLKEKYSSVEIGDIRTSIADTIAEQAADIQAMPTSADMQKAIISATAWITGGGGGYLVAKRNAEGQFSELLIMDTPELTDTTKLWRWNSGGLGFSANGGQTYKTAITQDGAIVADFITTGTLSANRIKGGTIDADQITVKNLNADNINSGTLKSPYLADGAVGSSKIASGAVISGKIGSLAVDGGNIATDAIINRHITSGSIAKSTCNSEVQGILADAIYANSVVTGSAEASKLLARNLTAYNFKYGAKTITLGAASSMSSVLGVL